MCSLQNKSVFIMAGYPGSGKSTLAQKLSQKLGCKHLSSDLIRNKLTGQARHDSIGDEVVDQARYSTYEVLYEEAKQAALQKKKVVIDASHVEPDKWLASFPNLKSAVPKKNMCFVLVKTPFKIINKRMKAFDTKTQDQQENPYQAWLRVYNIFLAREQQGLIK